MVDVTFSECPFVATLPKREKSKMAKVWERFQELARITEEKGMLVPVPLVAKVLGVSRQRCGELIKLGRLESVEVDGHHFVVEASVVAYAQSERKAGRPVKPLTVAQCVAVASEHARKK